MNLIDFTLHQQNLWLDHIEEHVLLYNTPMILCGSVGLGLDIARFVVDARYCYGYALNAVAISEQCNNLQLYYHYVRASVGWKFLKKNKLKNTYN